MKQCTLTQATCTSISMELYLWSAPLIRTGITSACRLLTQAAKLAHALRYRWRSVPQDLRQASNCVKTGSRCRTRRPVLWWTVLWHSGVFSLLLQTCFIGCPRLKLLDWLIIRLPEQRLTSLGTAIKSSHNLDRSSSPLAAHVSVNQMSNSTLLRWWYVWSGRVGMNTYPHGLLSSIQPEHRTPGHGSSYDILACSFLFFEWIC